jgi:hypothetical protein
VHIKAWRESGLSVAAYCRQQDLTRSEFKAWHVEIEEWEAQKAEARRRFKLRYARVSQDSRQRATQAFWAMHVEAWQWSGLPLRDYCSTLRLSSHSLRRWRNLIEAEQVTIDWRALLHPSSRPLISTKRSTRTKETERVQALTAEIEAAAEPLKKARRRRFSTEEKIALLLEAERHNETISSVSRRHGISTSVLFRWRDQFGMGREKPMKLAAVQVVEDRTKPGRREASLFAGLLPCPEGMKEVELADGRRVFAPIEADPDDVLRVVLEQENRS